MNGSFFSSFTDFKFKKLLSAPCFLLPESDQLHNDFYRLFHCLNTGKFKMSVAVVIPCSQIRAGKSFERKLSAVGASPDRLDLGLDSQLFIYF